nr:hypothetical protein [Tanacetum cinerariifolium]
VKKLEKSHDPLALVAYTGSSSRTTTPYYVTHPSLVVDYDDDYQGDAIQNNSEDPLTSAMILLARAITQCFSNLTNNHLRTSSNTINQAIIQGDRNDAGNIQRTLRTASSGTTTNVQCYNCSEKGVIRIDEQNNFLFADASRMEEIEKLSVNICLMARFNQQTLILMKGQVVILHLSTSNNIFDEPNGDVNSGSVEYDNNVQESYALEQLAVNAYKEAKKQQIIAKNIQQQNTMLTKQLESYKDKTQPILKRRISEKEDKYHDTVIDLEVRAKKKEDIVLKMESYALEQLAVNAYKEAKKQQIIAKNVQQQNTMLTKQLESYKDKVRGFKKTNGNNTTYFNEHIEADRKGKRFKQESQSQFICDRDTIRDLEQKRDKLDLSVIELIRQIVELQKTQPILKRRISEKEDKYHDTVIDLEARAKKKEDIVLKMGNSLQGMFMLGPKLMLFYDSKVKHGLGIQMNVIDTEDIFDDATKSQIKMKKKSQDLISIEKKENVWTIDYKNLNDLYGDFVPQKEFSAEQKYFSSTFTSS